MARAVAEIETEIRGLDREDKEWLLGVLLEDLDGPPDAGVDAAWLEEVQRRSRQLDAGEVEAIPAAEVFAHVRAQLRR
jgi:hypothetical protein